MPCTKYERFAPDKGTPARLQQGKVAPSATRPIRPSGWSRRNESPPSTGIAGSRPSNCGTDLLRGQHHATAADTSSPVAVVPGRSHGFLDSCWPVGEISAGGEDSVPKSCDRDRTGQFVRHSPR
jgi:hypothetical protein